MYLLSEFWDAVGSAIIEAMRSLMLSLCEMICKLIVFFFDIFSMLGSAKVLTDEKLLEIYEHVGLILGLFMIFRVVFALIQYIVNPDIMFDKQKGLFNIIKKIVIAIVLLGVTPSLFKLAYDAQGMIVDSGVIPKVITGTNVGTNEFGKDLAWYSFSSFFKFDERLTADERFAWCPAFVGEAFVGGESTIQKEFYGDVNGNMNFRYAYNCLNKTIVTDNDDEKYYVIEFEGNGFVAVVVCLVILWMIVTYCIQVGIRVVQLAYLQIIAPIPIIMYVTPKGEETFNKWVKQCTTTYLDFFMRVSIIYLVVYIVQLLMELSKEEFLNFDGVSSVQLEWIKIVMILAVLVFASKLPKLIQELFPMAKNAASFDFSLSPKKVFNDTLAARAIGATVGFVGAGASNAIHGYMNMRKAWKQNKIDKKWSDMSDDDRKKFARTWGSKNIKGWADMTDAQKEAAANNNLSEAEAAYNKNRLAQMGTRTKAVSGAAVKGAFSVAGGQIGGAVAGLKTKDISKSGDAIKTANANREKRALREEAGYHWYNPIPLVGDKILEFSGDLTEEDIKKRNQAIIDEKEREHRMSEGESLYNSYTYVNEEGDLKFNYRVAFASQEYIDSYENIESIKKQLSAAEKNMDSERANFQAAYNSGDEKEIAKAEARLNAARGNLKSMQGKLDDAKVKHEKVKSDHPEDARREDSYKYYKDNRTSEIVDIDKAGREAAANYDAKREVKETKITSKEEQINDTEKELNELEQEVIVAIAHGDSEDVQKKRKEYEALEKQRDLLYEELSELEDSSVEKFKPSVDASTQPQSSVSGVKYTMDDLRKAEREYRRYEQLERFGRATDVEVQQKKNEYERIRQWLENNNN